MSHKYVIRVVLMPEEVIKLDAFIELLAGMGYVVVHRTDNTGMCFDIKHAGRGNGKFWADANAIRMQKFGFNAVCAPEWKDS